MARKGGIIGGIITLIIGGTVFSVSQTDIAKNFSKDTGVSQKEAEEYVKNVKEEDLVSFDKLGESYISDGQDILKIASEIDCTNYYYKWETNTLSCPQGKSQLESLGNNEIALGKGYTTLNSQSASKEDMASVIKLIDKVNLNLKSEVVQQLLDFATIDENQKTNSYNKALLQAALDSK